MKRGRSLALFALFALVVGACDRDIVVLRTSEPFFPPPFFPPPIDQFTAQRELGRLLFFEKELSGSRTMACASCHVVFLQATEPLPLSVGTGGTGVGPTRTPGSPPVFLARNTPDLFLRSQFELDALFWDGRIERLPNGQIRAPFTPPAGLFTLPQVQALMPLIEPDEMLGHVGEPGNDLAAFASNPSFVWSSLMARLMSNPTYLDLFSFAFPEAFRGTHDITHVARALEAFEIALWERFDTPVDLPTGSFDGGSGSLDPLAEQGRQLFFGDAGCARCHGGTLFSDVDFHNLGVPQFGPGKNPATGLDDGRMLATGLASDRFRFRTPPLRNVALTGPYMHNGAFPTLESAIRHHLAPEASLRGYTGDTLPPELAATLKNDGATLDLIASSIDPLTTPLRPLSDAEVDALVAFLKALTSTVELGLVPEAGVPVAVPSGLPVDVWPGGVHPSRFENFGF